MRRLPAVGDRVVALAPGAGGTVVTSGTGTVVALDAVVADSTEQAAEDLRREWKAERRLTWAIDEPAAPGGHVAPPSRNVDAALRRGRLLAERHAIRAAAPADPTTAIRAAERESWTAYAAGGLTWRPAGATTPTTRSTGGARPRAGSRQRHPATGQPGRPATTTTGTARDGDAARASGVHGAKRQTRRSMTSARPKAGASTGRRQRSPAGWPACSCAAGPAR